VTINCGLARVADTASNVLNMWIITINLRVNIC